MSIRLRRPTSPGVLLKHFYMEPRNITITSLAEAVGVSRKHMSHIVNGHCRIEPSMAYRLACVLDTSPQLWMNAQNAVDLWDATQENWKPSHIFSAQAHITA